MKPSFILQVHPNADRPPHLRLKIYEFAGRVVGKCLYESALGGAYKQLVRARFTRSFLAQIIGLRMNYKVRRSLFFYCLYWSVIWGVSSPKHTSQSQETQSGS